MSDFRTDTSISEEIDAIIAKFTDWRGERMTQIRNLIKQADPDVIEEVKWRKPTNPDGIPVWSHNGMICTGETYKKHLRIAFAKGQFLNDPTGILNSYRALMIHEDDKINEEAFKKIITEAVEFNQKK